MWKEKSFIRNFSTKKNSEDIKCQIFIIETDNKL